MAYGEISSNEAAQIGSRPVSGIKQCFAINDSRPILGIYMYFTVMMMVLKDT